MNPVLNSQTEISKERLLSLRESFESTEGMISFDEAILIYSLARNATKGSIVEIGSYRGRSTVFLGLGSIDGNKLPVYAVDPQKKFIGVLGGIFGPQDRTAFYQAMLRNNCSEIVSLINLSSECFAANWKEPVSLLWIDGDHSYHGVKRDFDCWREHLSPSALIAFDDATDENLGPRQLIEELKKNEHCEEMATVGKVSVIKLKLQA